MGLTAAYRAMIHQLPCNSNTFIYADLLIDHFLANDIGYSISVDLLYADTPSYKA